MYCKSGKSDFWLNTWSGFHE